MSGPGLTAVVTLFLFLFSFYNLWLWLIKSEKQAVFCLSAALMNLFLMGRALRQDSQGPRAHF
jgi:hypothetical protein